MKKALIFGISGQDGTLLADFLLKKGYEIYGTSRDIELNEFKGLIFLNIKNQIKLCSLTLTDYKSVLQVIEEISPDEIYNLAGETSVAKSFQNPIKTTESIVNGTFNILEALKVLNLNIKFFNASSS
ncbi:MAG: GDP-mannose 4,6-dehydratase, partial [Candidatus Kapabacteria bacterium]|nr:GDP-mannose 4,6-dehydratase [Candidatus Kapabacteria bacterium]